MNRHKSLVLSMMIALCGSAAMAQDTKFEFAPFLGYTASSGVPVREQDLGNGLALTRISPKSSFSWGFDLNFHLTENFAAGFLWSEQLSQVRAKTVQVTVGPADLTPPTPGSKDIADLNVYTYHGTFTYNFGAGDAAIRPFVFGGLGATQYSPGSLRPEAVPLEDEPSGNTELSGFTKFSTTWGGGVKAFVSPHVGFRFAARWTPTYIKSEGTGIWCSPYWPWNCWVVGNEHWSNQGMFSAGVVFRF